MSIRQTMRARPQQHWDVPSQESSRDVTDDMNYGEGSDVPPPPGPKVNVDALRESAFLKSYGEENEVTRKINAVSTQIVTYRAKRPNVPNFTPDELVKLESLMKEALRSIDDARTKDEEASDIEHSYEPGALVLGPWVEPLLDPTLSQADKSVITTPYGALISKCRPHVIVAKMGNDHYLTVPAGTCGGKVIDDNSARVSPEHVRKYVRLAHKAAKPPKLEGVPDAILMETHGSLQPASNLHVTSLCMLRHKDIVRDCGNRVATESVGRLIEILIDRNTEHLQALAKANSLELRVTKDIRPEQRPSSRGSAGQALRTQEERFRRSRRMNDVRDTNKRDEPRKRKLDEFDAGDRSPHGDHRTEGRRDKKRRIAEPSQSDLSRGAYGHSSSTGLTRGARGIKLGGSTTGPKAARTETRY